MEKWFHSVRLDADKCVGCTDCIKRCPTEAIRVRDRKAKIIKERCIDCGLCIDVCKRHAKLAATDNLKCLSGYKYKIAIIDPAFFAQFKDILDANRILTGVKRLGFDDVLDASYAAYITAERTALCVADKNVKKPVISSFCPAVTRLIAIKFPSLIDNIAPVISPMAASAKAARNIIDEKGIAREDAGVFYITPCAANSTASRVPFDVESSDIDGVISMRDIFIRLKIVIKGISPIDIESLCAKSVQGMGCAASGGIENIIANRNSIAVDGIDNITKVLEYVENGQLDDVDFIECSACNQGCLGGCLTVNNNFVAKNTLKRVMDNTELYSPEQCRNLSVYFENTELIRKKPIKTGKVMNLDGDMEIAIKKMSDITRIYQSLPKIDCGSCGAPTCMAFAEDIVQEKAGLDDCIFMKGKSVDNESI